jgi:hypothetical protein
MHRSSSLDRTSSDESSVARVFGMLAVLPIAWLWLQWTHETGHVLSGLLAGASIDRVVLDPIAFSRTDLSANPNPLLICWGGPVVGCLIGAGLPWLISAGSSGWRFTLRVIACFVLVGNGAYIGLGAITPVGDAEVLRDLGTPRWLMAAFGLVCFALAAVLYRWIRSAGRRVSNLQMVLCLIAAILLASVGRLMFPV